jgi:large subunit ribosomal protein L10
MAVSKEKKQAVLDDLKKIIKDAGSVVFVNFHGLPVNSANEVRKSFREKGVGYTVAKKTLVRKAFSEGKIEGSMPDFEGELAIAYSKELTDSAREVYAFEKKLDKKISIVGGVFEGRFMNKEEMTVIAQIPPLKTLYAQFVNVINSPIQGFVMALSEIAKKQA